jgi:hypothetical protein
MFKFLITLHPRGIRTRELLFCGLSRWPLCHAARANFKTLFHRKNYVLIFDKKLGWATFWATFFTNTSGHPGVDVMITIFCDFRQFSAKKLAFFSKTNVMIKILHSLPLFWVKNANFCQQILRKHLKNHNIGPWFQKATNFFLLETRLKKGQCWNCGKLTELAGSGIHRGLIR